VVIVEWASWRSLQSCIGTRNQLIPFSRNGEQAGQYRVVQEGDERFLIKTYANGEKVREPIVEGPRKKRYLSCPYWHWTFAKTKEKGF